MSFISVTEASAKWGISESKVIHLCEHGMIIGAKLKNVKWMVPERFEGSIKFPSTLKPFVKWAGGKTQIINEIRTHYPMSNGLMIKKYAEPFVGGGAVLFDVLSLYSFETVYINDINTELIRAYKIIRDKSQELISILCSYEKEYLSYSQDERKNYYYRKRTRFNEIKGRENQELETAAIFIFLNKTCFNGLFRVNRDGAFNVPMGKYKNPLICDIQNIQNVSQALQSVEIFQGDYREVESKIDEDTFVYFDPPYRPLSTTANFTSYTQNGFDDKAQKELAKFVGKLSNKGAKIVLSNSDPKNSDPDDEFFDDLYAGFSIKRIQATRMINSRAEKRGKVNELLISNFNIKKDE